MAYNLADLFEHAADAVPERVALVMGDEERTYRALEARANALAHHLADHGVGPGAHVGIYGLNSIGWVEAMLASFKLRAVPVNINYRYVADELRYLFDDADLVALVVDEDLLPNVDEVRDELPLLRHVVTMAEPGTTPAPGTPDGPVGLEAAIAGAPTERDFGPRSADDHVIIYTGGTTGMPKGVMWRAEDIYFALMGGIEAFSGTPVEDEHQQSRAAAASPGQLVFLTIPPLMHGAAFCGTLMQLFQGNQAVLIRRFDPEAIWRTVVDRGINSLLITGDAMGRPLIETLERLEAEEGPLELGALLSVSSSAAVFSPAVKERFLARFPNVVLTDSIGSTESGFNGIIAVAAGKAEMKGGGPTVAPGRDVAVLDDDLRPVAPGSGVVGRMARGGNIPLGYYGDEAKTAATFVTGADGRRYAVPGDFATVEADGSITLLGRGSVCINTGGEKVYPEEVEQALKAHPDVFDALVVGVPDERWGQKVVAVVQPRPGHQVDPDEVEAHCRTHVAGYKIPRQLHLVDEIVRSPAGKPDYPWAKRLAEGRLDATPAG
jgi:acyl-CoA synthetase (AMP-forming)/AMP-acid ligase II